MQSGTCPYGTRCRFIHGSGLASSPTGGLASPAGYRAASAPLTGDGAASPLSYPASRVSAWVLLRSAHSAPA